MPALSYSQEPPIIAAYVPMRLVTKIAGFVPAAALFDFGISGRHRRGVPVLAVDLTFEYVLRVTEPMQIPGAADVRAGEPSQGCLWLRPLLWPKLKASREKPKRPSLHERRRLYNLPARRMSGNHDSAWAALKECAGSASFLFTEQKQI